MDNDLKFEVEFLSNMALEMQEGIAKKVRRMVIRQIIGD
jgi:hypothetical protein